MSGICGIIHIDGERVDRCDLDRMAQASAVRGVDLADYDLNGAVGFVALRRKKRLRLCVWSCAVGA